MFFYRLKIHQYFILAFIIAICFGYVFVDQYFIPKEFRLAAFLTISLIFLLIFFIIVKPDKPFALARTLSLILGVFDLTVIIIFHVIITFDVSYKNFIILASGIIIPFIAGAVYLIIRKIKPQE